MPRMEWTKLSRAAGVNGAMVRLSQFSAGETASFAWRRERSNKEMTERSTPEEASASSMEKKACVRLYCGSRSISRTRPPKFSCQAPESWAVTVVLPTPPFRFITATTGHFLR